MKLACRSGVDAKVATKRWQELRESSHAHAHHMTALPRSDVIGPKIYRQARFDCERDSARFLSDAEGWQPQSLGSHLAHVPVPHSVNSTGKNAIPAGPRSHQEYYRWGWSWAGRCHRHLPSGCRQDPPAEPGPGPCRDRKVFWNPRYFISQMVYFTLPFQPTSILIFPTQLLWLGFGPKRACEVYIGG